MRENAGDERSEATALFLLLTEHSLSPRGIIGGIMKMYIIIICYYIYTVRKGPVKIAIICTEA